MDSLYYPSNEDRVARRVFIVVAALLLLSVPGTDNEGRFLEAAPDNGSLGAPILIGEASAHRSNSHLSNTHRYQLHQMKVLSPVDCPIREKLRVIREYMRGPVGARFHEDVRVAIRPVMRLWLDSGPLAQTAMCARGRDKAHGSASDILDDRLTDITGTSVIRQGEPFSSP